MMAPAQPPLALFVAAVAAAAWLGCSGGSRDGGDMTPTVPVADGSSDRPAGVPGCGYEPQAGWSYPPGPYGSGQVGEKLEAFELEDCDGRKVRFADVLGAGQMTLMTVGAGWCQPCIEETKELEAAVHARFCGRGLRIVQVLFQDEQSRPATKFFCRQWRDRFGLRFPVVVDPLFTTERYLSAAQVPLNLLVDRDGVVRLRTTGEVPHDFVARIDALLPR